MSSRFENVDSRRILLDSHASHASPCPVNYLLTVDFLLIQPLSPGIYRTVYVSPFATFVTFILLLYFCRYVTLSVKDWNNVNDSLMFFRKCHCHCPGIILVSSISIFRSASSTLVFATRLWYILSFIVLDFSLTVSFIRDPRIDRSCTC